MEEERSKNNTITYIPIPKDENSEIDPTTTKIIEKPEESKQETLNIPTEEEDCLTVRAVFVGLLIGCLIAAMNINFGLKTGWTQGGFVFSALLGIGIFKILRPIRILTKSETAIITTTASALGTMASALGLVTCFPALKLLGHTFTYWELTLWGLSTAFFGVYFAVPIRHQMIVVDKLRFPTGTITAETIKTMFAESDDTAKKSKILVVVAILTGVFALLAFFIPYISQPPVPLILAQWGWYLSINPLLIGGGMLTGPRASSSLLFGAILGWGIIGPIVHQQKWVTGSIMHFDGVRGWILWIGVAIMTSDSAVTILFSLKMIFTGLITLSRRIMIFGTGLTQLEKPTEKEDENRNISITWVIIGVTCSTILATFVGQFAFSIQFYFVWYAIPLSGILAIIAARSCGETNINPVGSVAKISQLIYAFIAPKQITTNLLVAGITGAGASQCGDMMQDLKTGYLLNVAPKKQFIAQCIGIFAGIFVVVPIYKLFDQAYVIGGEDIPAPAAQAWKAVALILSDGTGHLPLYSDYGILAAALFGFILSLLHKTIHHTLGEEVSCYFPNVLAIGIGMIVPPKQAVTMFIGAMIITVWRLVHSESAHEYGFTISSGLVSGEGIMGVFIAFLKLVGVKPLVTPHYL